MAKFLFRRLLWLVAGIFIRRVATEVAQQQITQQRDQLAGKLPGRVKEVVERIPGDPLTATGSVLAAGQATRKGFGASQRVFETARHRSQQLSSWPRPLRAARRSLDAEIGTSLRVLRSEYRRSTEGPDAATNEMLDLRKNPQPTTLPEIPKAVPSGRFRRGRRPRRQVARMQRTYKRPTKPWDHELK